MLLCSVVFCCVHSLQCRLLCSVECFPVWSVVNLYILCSVICNVLCMVCSALWCDLLCIALWCALLCMVCGLLCMGSRSLKGALPLIHGGWRALHSSFSHHHRLYHEMHFVKRFVFGVPACFEVIWFRSTVQQIPGLRLFWKSAFWSTCKTIWFCYEASWEIFCTIRDCVHFNTKLYVASANFHQMTLLHEQEDIV